jgi:adenylate cyclase
LNREKLKDIIDRLGRFFEHNRYAGLIIGFVAFILIVPFTFTDTYKSFELKLYDLRFKIKPSIAEWDKLYFLDIDEYSTVALGQFPWTRDIYAASLDLLRELGAEQVAFDIMFPDPSPLQVNESSYMAIQKNLASRKPVGGEELSSLVINPDSLFAQSGKANGTVILAYTFSDDELTPDQAAKRSTREYQAAVKRFDAVSSIPVPANRSDEFKSLTDHGMINIVYPIPVLMQAGKMFGFVNRFTDIDGTIRRVRLIQVFNNRIYFNLSLVMLMDACGVKKEDIVVNPGKNIILKDVVNPFKMIQEDITIPIDKEGMLFVNWAGPGAREQSFRILPFYSLVEYNVFAPTVYENFDSIGGPEGIQKRVDIDTKLAGLKRRYASETSAEKKIAMLKEQKELKAAMRKEKYSYFNKLKEMRAEIEKEYEVAPSSELKDTIDIINAAIKNTELVLRTEEVRDKILIIGLTATGTHDIASIPLHNEYPGVGTYHNVVNTIINGKYILKPGTAANVIMIFCLALLAGFATGRLTSRKSLAVAILSFVMLNLIIFMLFAFSSLWVEQLGANLALLVPSVCIISIKLINEEGQKRFIKNAFSRYMAPDVIEQLMKNPEALELGGVSRPITIFFSDVAGFSTISEKLTPSELVALLNEYLSEMTDIIISHGGTIDKYEGDAIMAFYGAPQPYPDHEIRACMAAIDMKKRLRELQEHWRNIGQHELYVRMGMNTGDAVVGNMGSRMRMDYTAMGDSVNLASRLEGANKHYGTTAMISENTYKNSKDVIDVRRLDIIRVVGKTEPILIYELLGRKGSLPQKVYDMIEKYDEGLELFGERQWRRALKCFKESLTILPDDGPSQTYIKRCEEFMKKPPSKNWDGVYTFKTK